MLPLLLVNYSSSKEGAEKVVKQVIEHGGTAVAIQGDVSKPEDVDRLFAETKKLYGKIDILVNNAGIYQFGAIDDLTVDEFHRQFNTNVLGLLLVTQGAVKVIGEHLSLLDEQWLLDFDMSSLLSVKIVVH